MVRASDNPFRTGQVLQVRYRLRGVTWAQLLARCAARRHRGAIIGPHGGGKTTLLEDLELRLLQQGFDTRFIRLDQEHRAFEAGFLDRLCAHLTPKDILLLDGAEQMGPLAWRWFRWRTRHAGGLLITAHQAGRLPTLWECRTSPCLLAGIAAELLGVASDTTRERAGALFRKHRGNLREALREWYDLIAWQHGLAHGNPAGQHLTAPDCSTIDFSRSVSAASLSHA